MNEVKFKANIADLLAVQAEVEAIPEIPAPAVADSGKVLTVTVNSSGETPVAEYGLSLPAAELPGAEVSDAGKVLTVTLNDAHTGVAWEAPEKLPEILVGDAGKVLTVNAEETGVEWAAASGGNSMFGYTSMTMPGAPGDIVLQSDNDTIVVLSDDDMAILAYVPLVMTIYMVSEQKTVTVNSLRKVSTVGMAGQYYWTTDDNAITLQEMLAPSGSPVQGHVLLLVSSAS